MLSHLKNPIIQSVKKLRPKIQYILPTYLAFGPLFFWKIFKCILSFSVEKMLLAIFYYIFLLYNFIWKYKCVTLFSIAGSQISWIKHAESGNLHELGCTNSLIFFSLINSYVNPGVLVPISLSSQLFFESAQLMWECCELFGDTVPWTYLGKFCSGSTYIAAYHNLPVPCLCNCQ